MLKSNLLQQTVRLVLVYATIKPAQFGFSVQYNTNSVVAEKLRRAPCHLKMTLKLITVVCISICFLPQ